jgi:cullin 4
LTVFVAEVELKRTLQSLACAKLRPLRKNPQGREIGQNDTFTVNKNFTHAKYRVKINQVQLKETKEENKQTHEQVRLDRELETQAAIVRIMKSKQKISHNMLITEVIEATRKRGVLGMPEIKKQIDKYVSILL